MSNTTENAKDTAKDTTKDGTQPAASSIRPSIASVAAKDSAAELLKQAVSAAQKKPSPASGSGLALKPQLGIRYAAIAASAVVLGTAFGLVAAPKPASVEMLGSVQSALETSRSETARLNAEVVRLGESLTALRDTNEVARTESRSTDTRVGERVSALEQTVTKKLAAVSDTMERAQREQTAQIVAQFEKRTAAVVPAVATIKENSAKTEPTTTGAIADTKPKVDTIEVWALRDVYAGVALLEDRKHRLLEVARGDTVPGFGRVDAVERRGRMWVVVLRKGIITPQAW